MTDAALRHLKRGTQRGTSVYAARNPIQNGAPTWVPLESVMHFWLLSPFGDEVVGGGEVGTWQGKQIYATFGKRADYEHILSTDLVRKVVK
jgi:hypothetical protein